MRKIQNLISILLPLLLLIPSSISNPICLVDKCNTCADPKKNQCQSCESGWYLKEWTGTETSQIYHDCWNSTYWWWGLIFCMFMLLVLMSICYIFYKLGQRKFLNLEHTKMVKNFEAARK